MTVKVMVSFPEEFLDEVDRLAKEEHRGRSELVREAIRLYISLKREKTRLEMDHRVREAVKIQDQISRIAAGIGEDTVSDIRRWQEQSSRSS